MSEARRISAVNSNADSERIWREEDTILLCMLFPKNAHYTISCTAQSMSHAHLLSYTYNPLSLCKYVHLAGQVIHCIYEATAEHGGGGGS